MPAVEPLSIAEAPLGLHSKFSHEREEAWAGYYRVHLDDYNIDVELTATPRCGIQRYTYINKQDSAMVVLNGAILNEPRISHEQLMKGGLLEFEVTRNTESPFVVHSTVMAVNVPYGSLLGVMTDDDNEKNQFSSYRMVGAYAMVILTSVGIGFYSPLLWSMYADVADYATEKNGTSSTGMIFSSGTMSQKFGSAISGALVALMLGAVGFISGTNADGQTVVTIAAENMDSVKNMIWMLFSIFPAIIAGLMILLVVKYPINK